MTHTNMLKHFVTLAQAVRDGGDVAQAAEALEREFGDALTYDTDELREFLAENRGQSREFLAESIADIMDGQEKFSAEIFKNYATSVYSYPHSPRKSWIMLADAISHYTGEEPVLDTQQINYAIDILPMSDHDRVPLIEAFGSLRQSGNDTRKEIAYAFAALLKGREKFDTGRFIFHATSNTSDNKWKYNELHPETAMKTTIEGGGETVIVL
jgi:hypothetical protein